VLVVVAVGVTTLLAAPSGVASGGCSKRAVSAHTAHLTIKRLHIVNKPIRTRACDLAYGPIWDLAYKTRPGMGLTMVIDAHDVTPVPGYGAHGPFYNLDLIKRGNRVRIEWNGVWRTYSFVAKPRPHPQQPQSAVNKPIKSFPVETIYFRCCWPRYTRNDYLTVRAVLVPPKPTS
jgi:sortase (surface protein transpeptidase)